MQPADQQTINVVPVQGVFSAGPAYQLQYFVGPAGTPFVVPTTSGVQVTDNVTSSATWYPTFVATNSGTNAVTVASTQMSFVPSTGVLTLAGGLGGGAF